MQLLTASKPDCYDFLWKHFVFGLDYGEIADERNMSYDNVRMKIGRCLEEAKSLVSEEVKSLQAERKQVRSRIEKLLGQIDQLSA